MATFISPDRRLIRPDGLVDPNPSSPLLAGVQMLPGLIPGVAPFDLIYGNVSALMNGSVGAGTAPVWAATKYGAARHYYEDTSLNVGTCDAIADFGAYDVGSGDFTAFAAFMWPNNGAICGIFSKYQSLGGATGWRLATNASNQLRGGYGNGASLFVGATTLSANVLQTGVLSRQGNTLYLYTNGGNVASAACSGSGDSTAAVLLGGTQNNSPGVEMQLGLGGELLACGLIKGRSWRQAEAREFHEAPFSVYKPLVRRNVYRIPVLDADITGTLSATLDGIDADFTGTASAEPDGDIVGALAATLDGITVAATGLTANFYDDFATSSIRLAGSTISGIGDAAIFSADQRLILSQAAPASARWLQSVFEIRGGISGLTPIIEFKDYDTWHPKISGTNWQSTRRLYYREWDGSDWGAWANFGGAPTIGATTVRYTHTVAFTSYRVQIATTIPFTVADDEAFLTAFAASYPNAVKNAASNTSNFRSLTYSSQTTDLGESTGTSFSLSAVIDDDDKPSPSGAKGRFDVNAGVHAGEHQGKRAFRAVVNRLMEDETKANYLRTHIKFHIRPTLNPIGGDNGHWRGDWSIAPGETTQTTDLNRTATDNAPSNELITNYQTLNSQDHADRSVVNGMVDLHGSFGSASATKFAGFYNIDEIASLDALRDAMEVYLGAGEIADFGPSSSDTVEKSYRDVWGAPLAVTLELTEQSPRTDADFEELADALVQSLYDTLQSGDWHFNVGTMAATLDGISASFTGTASEAPADESITGTFAATLDDVTAAFTGDIPKEITGSFSADLDGISAAFAGTASEAVIWSVAAPASTNWTVQ